MLARLKRWLTWFVSLLAGVYAPLVLVYWLLRWLAGDRWWWLAFLNNFAVWYFLPLVVLLPLALLARSRRGLLLLLPVTVFAVVLIVPYYVPSARAAADGPALRVVTFNIWGGNGRLGNGHYENVAAWLREVDADVVLLQEVPRSQRTREDGFLGLGDRYAGQIAYDSDDWTNAILTRLPVIAQESHDMTDTQPRYQRVVVEFEGEQIAIYSVHAVLPVGRLPHIDFPVRSLYESVLLRYDESVRNVQLDFLLDRLASETLPYVVAGDFNTGDQTLAYTHLAAQMHDSFREVGAGYSATWPLAVVRGDTWAWVPPLVRIDYVWHSDGWVAQTATRGPALGSDHLPVMATLARVTP
ncbi:MAG: endonuclease/exonuclease/phosphatase family protein [Anaerolineae bacterium]|nr:endonuclease/exonuclease/phosphatase family protein [Anaerolineae bacterium]